MSVLHRIFNHNNYFDSSDLSFRQYRMIFYTSCELMSLCLIIIYLYFIPRMWFMVILFSAACLLSSLNLWLLIHTKNTHFCGHVLTSITLLTAITANFLVGGMGTPYTVWYYVIPFLAVTLVGWGSLLIYSLFSLLMIIVFGILQPQSYYHLTLLQTEVIGWINHLAAFLVIVSLLYRLAHENWLYEKLLKDNNYLLQAEKDKFQHLSRFDQLTNLPNRSYFLYYLQELIDSLPKKHVLTVFFMDLDNLKYVNDQFGHIAGDNLLRHTAKRLQSCFRESDFVARLGGDEFTAAVLHTQNEKIINEITKRIRSEFNKPIVFENIEYSSSISIGLATYPNDAKTLSELMIKADLAMYASKKNGIPNEPV